MINKVCSSLLRNRPDLSSHRQDIISDGVEIALGLVMKDDLGDEDFEKHLRRELQRRARSYSPRMEELFSGDLYENIQDDSPDLSEIVDARIMSDALRVCISRLPVTQRNAIILYYYCGLTQEQAANRIGIKQAGLSRRLERARRRITEVLTEMGLSPFE